MTDAADREAVAYRWRRPGWDYVVTEKHPENRQPRVTDYTDLEPLYADSDEGATVTDTPERDPTRTEDVEERVFPPITRQFVDCYYDRTEGYSGCYDCGRRYGGAYGFPDLIVPDEVWERISPTGDQGGLLCPSCIVKRLAQEDIECEAVWKSGPLEDRAARRRADRLEEAVGEVVENRPTKAGRRRGYEEVPYDAIKALRRAYEALDSREDEGEGAQVWRCGECGWTGTGSEMAGGGCGFGSVKCPGCYSEWEFERVSVHADEPVSGEGDRGGPLDQLVALLRVDRRDLNHGHTVGKYACRKCGPLGGEMSALDCLDAEHIVYGPFRTEPIAEKVMGLIDHQFRDATHADARSEGDREKQIKERVIAIRDHLPEYLSDRLALTELHLIVETHNIVRRLSDRHEDESDE